jgi:hypothetical protein
MVSNSFLFISFSLLLDWFQYRVFTSNRLPPLVQVSLSDWIVIYVLSHHRNRHTTGVIYVFILWGETFMNTP